MPTYNQCALYVESIVKSGVNQLVKLTCVHRSRCATILKSRTDKSFHSYTQYHTMSSLILPTLRSVILLS